MGDGTCINSIEGGCGGTITEDWLIERCENHRLAWVRTVIAPRFTLKYLLELIKEHRVGADTVAFILENCALRMRLFCEVCGEQHIDEGEYATKLHHTHTCQRCGLNWRPAVEYTVGIQFLPGFKDGGEA